MQVGATTLAKHIQNHGHQAKVENGVLMALEVKVQAVPFNVTHKRVTLEVEWNAVQHWLGYVGAAWVKRA